MFELSANELQIVKGVSEIGLRCKPNGRRFREWARRRRFVAFGSRETWKRRGTLPLGSRVSTAPTAASGWNHDGAEREISSKQVWNCWWKNWNGSK